MNNKKPQTRASCLALSQKQAVPDCKAKAHLAQAASLPAQPRKEEVGLAEALPLPPVFHQVLVGAVDAPADSKCADGAVGDARHAISTQAFGRGGKSFMRSNS